MDLDKVLELFRDYWKMDRPQLFLSIISNETRRKEDPEESDETRTRREAIETFCDKLVEAAIQTSTSLYNHIAQSHLLRLKERKNRKKTIGDILTISLNFD